MTEQEQKAFTAMREALENIAGDKWPDPEMTAEEYAREALTVANAVSHPQATEPAWMPIESAPHSANPVLALSESGTMKIETGYWLVNMLHASKVDGENCNYTHWMPLPAAPEAP